ncbi:sugar-binding transcriptional regulator [Nonomuraea cavernae]|uniref:Transcriptional regulator n=1 Tax=Nonomuraea cavernae TaxID=2045107 RepID=A0A918DGG7_9ACTN|nr:sugar-binding domain-containing protein [Nonomuraea cavernae]MCA2185070.1 MarR family transcriptional regulator [Nonomuraea cavernae]GGO65315.1 transcriptional regulator [Nonomuraea cavernae]
MNAADVGPEAPARFPQELMYAAASQYYLEDATQADIAKRLGVSRATVSRLLTEARKHGLVEIRVHRPSALEEGPLAAEVAAALRLERVYLVPKVSGPALGPWLAPGLARALAGVGLTSGDVILVSSGSTIYECAREGLGQFPGVTIAPAVGGQEDPQPWFQTNETTRLLAERVGGVPSYLYAPALPGPELFYSLQHEPSVRRVMDLWGRAKCAIVGVGSPPVMRQVVPAFVPRYADSLRQAVGDVCSRFYDRDGEPVGYPGSERLVATALEDLRRIPFSIAVAVGPEKVGSIVAGARGGYFNRLVTDALTAEGLLTAVR